MSEVFIGYKSTRQEFKISFPDKTSKLILKLAQVTGRSMESVLALIVDSELINSHLETAIEVEREHNLRGAV